MAKSSTRRVTIYINGKEVEASVIFGFFVFSPPPKPPPMNRCRTFCQMNPLTGISSSRWNALGYRYASSDGDGRSHGTSTTHSVAHSPSATNPCRPTACTTHTTPSSSPSPSTVHCSHVSHLCYQPLQTYGLHHTHHAIVLSLSINCSLITHH